MDHKAKADEERLALIERLRQENAGDLIGPLEKCGEAIPIMCTHCGERHQASFHCRRRWCPCCARMLAATRTAKWGKAIESLQWPLFLTLTIPNSEDPEALRFLRGAWSKFRRRKLIRTKIRGGVAGFEITNKGEGWHPHLHAVADCRWLSLHVPEPRADDSAAVKKEKCRLAQLELSSLWADQIKHDHAVVWVSRVKGGNIAKEVLKYACKGSELLESESPISPMLRVLAKTRTLSGWGSLHPLPSPDEEEKPLVSCDACGEEGCFMPEEIVHYLMR